MADIDFNAGGDNGLEALIDDQDGLFDTDASDFDVALTPLQRLSKYVDSDQCYFRQTIVRSLLDTLRQCEQTAENASLVFNAIVRLSDDNEGIIRAELIKHMFSIMKYCKANQHVYQSTIVTCLLPVIIKLLSDYNREVRKASLVTLLKVIKNNFIDQGEIEYQVLPVFVQLSDQDSPDDFRSESVMLMASLAPWCTQSMVEQIFLPRFINMCSDAQFQVRKACAVKFGMVCKAVGETITETQLLPNFMKLCEDGVWGVRKACIECFIDVACACSVRARRDVLIPLFLGLINDQSRWVRMAAFQALGAFISTFADSSHTGLQLGDDGTIIFNQTDGENILIGADNTVTSQCGVSSSDSSSSLHDIEAVTTSSTSTDVDIPVCPSSLSTNPTLGVDIVADQLASDTTVVCTMDESNPVSAAETNVTSLPSADETLSCVENMQVDEVPEVIDEPIVAEDSEGTISTALNANCVVQDSIISQSLVSETLNVDCHGIDFLSSAGDKVVKEDAMVTEENHSITTNDSGCEHEQHLTESLDAVIEPSPKQSNLPCFVNSSQLVDDNSLESIAEPQEKLQAQGVSDLINGLEASLDTCSSESSKSTESSVDDVVIELVSNGTSEAFDGDVASTCEDLSSQVVESGFEKSALSVNGLESALMADIDSVDSAKCVKSDVRVHTASLNEVNGPAEEMVAHIGSTRIHVADELNVVNGIVKPVDSGVKIDVTRTPPTLSLKDISQVESCKYSNASLSSPSESCEDILDTMKETSGRHLFFIKNAGLARFGLFAGGKFSQESTVTVDIKPTVLTAANPLHQTIVPHILLDHYISMIDPRRAQTTDSEIACHCAYSLPAVTYTLGRRNWPYLSQLFQSLARDMQWKVRRTLAYSLHQLAIILGDELTRTDILPVFEDFMHDVDEVRIALMKHMCDFLQLVSSEERSSFISKLYDLLSVDNTKNWRFRQDLAKQLVLLTDADVLSIFDICEHVLPIILTVLAKDSVAQVRQSAVQLLNAIYWRLSASEERHRLSDLVSQLVHTFAESRRWSERQLFVSLCDNLFNQVEAVECEQDSDTSRPHVDRVLELFMGPLLQLHLDRVPNVRIALARCLSRHFINQVHFCDGELSPYRSSVELVITALQTDRDSDVRYLISHVPDQHNVSCNDDDDDDDMDID